MLEYSNNNVLRNRLLIKMRENDLSQKDLSLKAQLSASAINHYVNGTRTPKTAELDKLATALGTTMDWLWGRTETSPQQSELAAEVITLRAKLAMITSALQGVLNEVKK